jgi:hypothetical protein
MTKKTIKKIIAANPSVDANATYEVLKVLRKLRRSGLPRQQYNLDIPFAKTLKASQQEQK